MAGPAVAETMRAVVYDPRDDCWVPRTLPMPTATGHDVLVRVHACGLNPVDAKIAHWKNAAPGMDAEWVAGLDVSGEIVAVGAAVTGWRVGDRVLGHGNMFRRHGGLAEYSVQDARALVAHPAVAAEVAAATPCAGWTAWRGLHDKLRLAAHDTLLIAGGAGGVGSFAVQIARLAGLRTIIATASAANAELVRSLGATHVIDYRAADVAAEVRAITGGLGVSRGLDCVGGPNARLVADSLGFEGELCELVDVVSPREWPGVFDRALSFHQLSLGSAHRHGDAARTTLTRTGAAFNAALEQGGISVPRLKVLTLDEAGPALVGMLKQNTVGKLVVRIAGT